MSKQFENHVSLLKTEISNISRNINNVKNKNHKTMTTIVKKLKRFTTYFRYNQKDLNQNQNQNQLINLKLNNNRKHNHSMTQVNSKRNYGNHDFHKLNSKQNVSTMKQNYNKIYDLNHEKNENGILNDISLNTKRLTNDDNNKQNTYKSINNMNLIYYKNLKNNNCNCFQRNYRTKPIHQLTSFNDQVKLTNSNYINDSRYTYKEIYNNKEKFDNTDYDNKNIYLKKNKSMFKTQNNYYKSNENIISNNLNNKIEKIQNILKCNNIDDCIKKLEKFDEIYQFIKKIKVIYKNSTGNINTNNGSDLNNILLWINNIANEKSQYEIFCKKIMYQKKIANFNDFQKYINQLLHNQKKENFIVRDIKKKLCDKNEIATVRYKNYINNFSKQRCKTEDKINNMENFEDILYD